MKRLDFTEMKYNVASNEEVETLTLVHYGDSKFQPHKFNEIKNEWKKPHGQTGLWTSPVNSKWGWKDWCTESYFNKSSLSTCFHLKFKKDSKVLKIDSYDDLDKLPLFFNEKYASLSKTSTFNILIDFEKLTKIYDAIWLTEKGQSVTHLSYPKNLYGWDCESVLILNKNCVQPIHKDLKTKIK